MSKDWPASVGHPDAAGGTPPVAFSAGSRLACLTMVFKLAMAAQKQWRALNGSQLIADVIDGVPFVDGLRKEAA